MRRILLSLAVLLLAPFLASAGTSQTQLIVQPIIAHGEAESWEGEDYRIVDVPYLKWYFQGHPAYEGIAQTNAILTDASRHIRLPESNLLAMMEVGIGYDFEESKLWLQLGGADEVEGWDISVEEAGYIALECIRRVAHRYNHRPTVIIGPPEGEEAKWQAIQERFAKHDFSKPFLAE